MKSSRRVAVAVFVLATVLLLAALPAFAQGPACVSHPAVRDTARWAETVAAARDIACRELAPNAPGLAVAVAVEGRLVWSEAFGYADVEARRPAIPATQFRIGSVSKPLTAAALGLLVEEGKLDLDAPISRYVPWFPDKGHPITTRQLAGHLAGIRHYRGDEFLLNRPFGGVREAITIFERDSLLHLPGTRYAYSSYGWNLISAVIEAAADEPFLTLMQRRVIGPLRLGDTAPDKNDSVIPDRTRFYQRVEGGGFEPAPEVDNSYKWAGGGYLSTAEDLVRFGSAHLAPGFLHRETLETWFTSQRTTAGEETGYGIGWGVSRDSLGHRVVSHGGGSVGGTTLLWVDRDSRVVVAVVSNVGGARLGAIREIARLFDGAAVGR